MTIALAKKQVQVAGPMAKMMKLLPALRPAFPATSSSWKPTATATRSCDRKAFE